MCAFLFEPRHDDLKIMHGAGQTVDAGDHQSFSGVDEVEGGATFLLSSDDHAAAGGGQGCDVGFQVRLKG